MRGINKQAYKLVLTKTLEDFSEISLVNYGGRLIELKQNLISLLSDEDKTDLKLLAMFHLRDFIVDDMQSSKIKDNVNSLNVTQQDVDQVMAKRFTQMIFPMGKLIEIGNAEIDQYIDIIHTQLSRKEGILSRHDYNSYR